MMNKLFKKGTTLLVALTLVVGVMTGFVFTKPVEAEASGETVHVYYDFQSKYTRAEFDALKDQTVIFVPKSLGIDFETAPCLPTIPQGSATQIVTDFSTGKTTRTDVGIGGAANNQTASVYSVPGTVIAKVITLVKGAGFDSCANGGYSYFNGTYGGVNYAKYIFYGCCGGGVSGYQCPGNVVSYKEKDVPVENVDAMVKPSVIIPEGEDTIIKKQDIQMSITVENKNYMVPGTLTDTDYRVDPSDQTVYIPTGEDDPKPLDDTIHVYFGSTSIPVHVHMHSWTYQTNDLGDTLYAECHVEGQTCPVTEVPQISLVLHEGKCNDVDSFGDPIPVCGYEMNTSWNYVAGGKPDIRYRLLDIDGATDQTTSPTRPGNYRAFLKVKGNDGVDYEIAKEFAIDKDGNIVESVGHVHQWKYSIGEGGTLNVECISKVGTCPFSAQYRLNAEVTGGEYGTGEDYTGIGITQMGKGELDPSAIEDLEMPEPVRVEYVVYQTEVDGDGNPVYDEDGNIKYVLDGTGKPKELSRSTTRPEGHGAYSVVQTYENPDGTTVTVDTPYTIFVGKDKYGNPLVGKFSVDVPYRYRYPGTGIDYTKGWIYYTQAQVDAAEAEDKTAFGTYNFVKIDDEAAARENLFNYPQSNDKDVDVPSGLYIDMFTETLVLPAGKAVAAYQLTKGGKWETGELTQAILQKAFDKGETRITIAFEWDESSKKAKGATFTFNKITKRPAADALKVNFIACADRTGRTNGQFILTNSDGKVMYNFKDKYDITIVGTKDAKNPSSIGWGVWPSTGGVWVPNMLKDSEGKTINKTVKYTFFIRNTAKVNSAGTTFTPASKVKKLSVSSVQKPVTVKADYKKEILKLKGGLVAYFGEEIIDITKSDYDKFVKDFGTHTYDAVKTPAVAATATQAAVDAVIEQVTFENFTSKYADQVAFADYEDLVVDYNKDVENNAGLKKSGIDISKYLTADRNTVKVWQKATDKKPASVVTDIVFAKRGEITAEIAAKLVPDAKGKVPLKFAIGSGDATANIQLEVAVTAKGKTAWKSSIPVAAKTELATAGALEYQIAENIYPIRVKSDAKGGKETATSNASGIIQYALVTCKNVSTGRSVKMGIEKVEIFATEEEAIAAKKIVKAEETPASP